MAFSWVGFMLFIGASTFAFGVGVHDESLAQRPAPRPEPIYYCVTGIEMPGIVAAAPNARFCGTSPTSGDVCSCAGTAE